MNWQTFPCVFFLTGDGDTGPCHCPALKQVLDKNASVRE